MFNGLLEVISTMVCIEQVAKWNVANPTAGETHCYLSPFTVSSTFSQFFQLLTWTSWGKSVNATGKKCLNMSKIAKYKSDTT